MTWNFRAGVKNPYGYVWFNDDSGLSRANGTIDPTTGAFHLTLTVLDGKGPTGTIDGVKGGDGSLKAVVTGPGCSNVTIYHAKPDVVDENDGSNQ
jgi:streptogramin lyase